MAFAIARHMVAQEKLERLGILSLIVRRAALGIGVSDRRYARLIANGVIDIRTCAVAAS